MASLEERIMETQRVLNSKQGKSGSLVLDNLTVNNPIDIRKLKVDNFEVKNLNVTGKITTKDLLVTGGSTFNNNVNINGGLAVGGNTTINGNASLPNVNLGELRNVSIKGWLNVETNITAGGEIRGSKVWNAVWN